MKQQTAVIDGALNAVNKRSTACAMHPSKIKGEPVMAVAGWSLSIILCILHCMMAAQTASHCNNIARVQ